MRIAVLYKPETIGIDPNYTGGQERVFLNDVALLARENKLHSSWGAAHFLHKSLKKKLKYQKLPFFHITLGSKFYTFFTPVLKIFYSLVFIFLANRADQWYTFEQSIPAIFSPTKTTVSFHDIPELFFWNLFKFRYKKAKYLFCSEFLKDFFKRKYPEIPDNRLFVIENAIDKKLFFYKKGNKNKEITFLFASAWVEEKGIYTVVRVVQKLISDGFDLKLLLVGSTDLWNLAFSPDFSQMTKKAVESTFSSEKIVVLGSQKHTELPEILNSVDYLLFPSIRPEPAPLICLEALACGVPVIAYDSGGLKEMIKNEKNGFLLKKSEEELYFLLKKIILLEKRFNKKILSSKFPDRYSSKLRNSTLIEFFDTDHFYH